MLVVRCVVTTIEKIAERLATYPGLKYAIAGRTITVDAPTPNGFALALSEDSNEWTVEFDGWHGHFESEDEALDYFAFGLSNQCRLRIARRGTFAYQWTVQRKTNSGWQDDYVTGLFLFPFWRRRHIEYRQNDVLGGI